MTIIQDSNQLTLPYEEITASQIAGRPFIRLSKFKESPLRGYFMPFNKIMVRDGFNRRTVFEEIDLLAESIATHGLKTPFQLDVLKDGRVFIKAGHRRHRAIQLLVEQGRFKKNGLVEFIPSNTKETELNRMIDQWVSNNLAKPFTPIEVAQVAFDLKYNFGKKKSNTEVAALLGLHKSRQTVDNYIAMIGEPVVADEVKAGNVTITKAAKFVKVLKKNQKQADAAELNANKTNPAPLQPPKDELKGELSELKRLDQFVHPENGVPHKEEKVKEKLAEFMEADKKREPKDRVELAKINAVIANFDKLELLVNKLKGPAKTFDDIGEIVKWIQADLSYCQKWIKTNKKR